MRRLPRPPCFGWSTSLASTPSTGVIWTTPGGSSPERRRTARISTPPLCGARWPTPTGAVSPNTAPNRRLVSGGISQHRPPEAEVQKLSKKRSAGAVPGAWTVSVLEQELDQAGCAVPALAAARLEARVELVDERSERQCGAAFPRLVEADAHVLPHPLGGEAEALGLQLVHLLPAILHLPGLRRALGDDADDFLDVELVAFRERDRLGEALRDAGDADLVHHLGELARAGRADERAHLGVHVEHGLRLGEGRVLAAAHDAELAVHRAGLAAGNGGVDEADAHLFRLFEHFAGNGGRCRRVVDEDRPLLHPGEDAAVAIDDR